MSRRTWSLVLGFALAGLGPVPRPSDAQVVSGPLDTARVVADASDVLASARSAQARFERRRIRYLPLNLQPVGGSCDENVGRFCSWYDEGDWFPIPERSEVVELRAELLAELDSAQSQLPGDPWILGQRVWYRAEGEDWLDALYTARDCRQVDAWWCDALQGFSLHGLGRYLEAGAAFDRALEGMAPEDAVEWRFPRRALDGEGRGIVSGLRDAPPDSAGRVLDRLWTLADPLYLVPGNDRRTEHFARWTTVMIRRRARNPFTIPWGRDLEELTVRHGWEMGWERSPGSSFASVDHAIGHKHPEGRDFMPSGRALRAPEGASVADLRADRTRPRSLYAPKYAPLFLPMDGQVAVFPRGERMRVVSTYFLPPDTTRHARHAHPVPWLDPGDQAGRIDRAGLFLVPVDGAGTVDNARRSTLAAGRTDGALMIEAPAGAYVASVELWSPERRRAGRQRRSLVQPSVPDDVAALSDILLLAPARREPESLEEALEWVLPRPEVVPYQRFAIAWEVSGLGFRPETLGFSVSVEKAERGVLRRIGEFLRLAGRPDPIRLEWEEPGPSEPGERFRYLALDLPDLEPGEYRITLQLATSGRSEARSVRDFTVVGS